MADAAGLGPVGGNTVGVRIPPPALGIRNPHVPNPAAAPHKGTRCARMRARMALAAVSAGSAGRSSSSRILEFWALSIFLSRALRAAVSASRRAAASASLAGIWAASRADPQPNPRRDQDRRRPPGVDTRRPARLAIQTQGRRQPQPRPPRLAQLCLPAGTVPRHRPCFMARMVEQVAAEPAGVISAEPARAQVNPRLPGALEAGRTLPDTALDTSAPWTLIRTGTQPQS